MSILTDELINGTIFLNQKVKINIFVFQVWVGVRIFKHLVQK